MQPVVQHEFTKQKALIVCGITILLALAITVIAFIYLKADTVTEFREIQAAQNVNTIFYDINQKPFHIIRGAEDRKYVPLKHVSRNLQKAIVAVEDARFFKHFGFDPFRIVSVLFRALDPNSAMQGASTITQQLVKLTLLSPERTLQRKIKEIFMAIALETEYSKSEILEFYINKVYLGHGNYGIENASLNYFHKSTQELSIAESAFIAGLIKKPEGYSPFVDLKKARQRQLLVLKRLLGLDWISREEYYAAANERLLIREQRQSDLKIAPFFVNHVMQELKQQYGHRMIYGGGLHVYTTLDTTSQLAMKQVIDERMSEDRSFEEIAGVSIDPTTGFVKALVGGADFFKSEFNRVTQAKRQPGSSFKPVLYAAAMTTGIRSNDVFWDEPTQYTRFVNDELEIYEPGNFSGEHLGQMTVSYALRTSNNVVSVQILNKIGIDTLSDISSKFGIELPDDRGLCLALGCGETTLLDLVDAYTVFVNQGYRNTPVFILKVADNRGNLLQRYDPQGELQVIPVDIAFEINRILQDVVSLGTGRNAKTTFPSGGKTGTSDQNRDAWYVGFTPNLVTGFWIGNDDNQPMIAEVGGKTPALLWKAYTESLPATQIQKSFSINENFEEQLICDYSGMLATAWCPSKTWYALKKNEVPLNYCSLHADEEIVVDICKSSGKLATQYCPITEVETKRFVSGSEPKTPCDIHIDIRSRE
ncbi:PBP1A family penicillin-binding protein [bacterium]|nr:PBP1A family penicillin-binding protein [bacterium]